MKLLKVVFSLACPSSIPHLGLSPLLYKLRCWSQSHLSGKASKRPKNSGAEARAISRRKFPNGQVLVGIKSGVKKKNNSKKNFKFIFGISYFFVICMPMLDSIHPILRQIGGPGSTCIKRGVAKTTGFTKGSVVMGGRGTGTRSPRPKQPKGAAAWGNRGHRCWPRGPAW